MAFFKIYTQTAAFNCLNCLSTISTAHWGVTHPGRQLDGNKIELASTKSDNEENERWGDKDMQGSEYVVNKYHRGDRESVCFWTAGKDPPLGGHLNLCELWHLQLFNSFYTLFIRGCKIHGVFTICLSGYCLFLFLWPIDTRDGEKCVSSFIQVKRDSEWAHCHKLGSVEPLIKDDAAEWTKAGDKRYNCAFLVGLWLKIDACVVFLSLFGNYDRNDCVGTKIQ